MITFNYVFLFFLWWRGLYFITELRNVMYTISSLLSMGSIPFLKFFCLLVTGEERLTLGAKWELANLAFLDSGAGVMEFPSLYQVQDLPATGSRLLAHRNLLPRALCMQAVGKNENKSELETLGNLQGRGVEAASLTQANESLTLSLVWHGSLVPCVRWTCNEKEGSILIYSKLLPRNAVSQTDFDLLPGGNMHKTCTRNTPFKVTLSS